jgi:predicted amidohydrolase
VSSVDQTLHDLPDLFCELYDGIDIATFRGNIDVWQDDPGLHSQSMTVASGIEKGRDNASRLRLRLANCDGQLEAIRFAVLRGMDRAFRRVNSHLAGGVTPPALARLAAHVAARHRLDSGRHGGALLPRLVEPGQPPQLADHPREEFTSVIRVPPQSWDAAEHRTLGEAALFHRHELLRGVRVACVPFVEDPDELSFGTVERRATRFYRIRPRDLDVTRERVVSVVSQLDAAGVEIALVPELTLTPRLLKCWQGALRAKDRNRSRLHWLLVGSGDLDGGRRPRNTAVLLNGRTGEVVARQHKLYPFNLSGDELRRWGLDGRLGDRPIDEDLEPGERLCILEAGVMRVAILVCEDLGRVVDLGTCVRDFGISHLLVPVFARPTKDRRWERAAADVHCRATGSLTVVSNSLVMRSILASGDGTALVAWPGAHSALVGRSRRPAEPACFVLLPDGTAEPA